MDEIQRMPELLNEVHRLIEDHSAARQFILTGSSNRKLRKAGVNLLAGRAGRLVLHPFVPEELGRDFDLEQALEKGLVPVIWSHHNKSFALKAYVEQYLIEEIKAEALVKDLSGFTRFLEISGIFHGQAVNMNAVARDAEISRKSVQEFFSILEDTMLGFFVPAYYPRLKVREKKHKKFYLADPGIARTVKNNRGPVSFEEKGPLFEGLVAQILRAYQNYTDLYDKMFYWSPSHAKNTEVDFLLQKGKHLIAIEAKAKPQVSSQDYKGLKAIKDLPNVKKRIAVYMGDTKRKTQEGIDIWPFDKFCKILSEKKLFH